MLNRVLAARAHATARRPEGVEAPRKVRVDIRANGRTLIMPWEVVDASRELDEASGEARESGPIRARRSGHAAATPLGREPKSGRSMP
eukprot:15473060-Alexandrium_andersonii.AAC.1